MIEQANVEIIWYAHYTSGGIGQTGLSPTITVYKDDSATPEVNAQSMTELADGIYYYKQTPSAEGFRVAVCKTTDTAADQRHLPAIMLIGKAGVEKLDATVSSRSSHDDPDPNGYLDAAMSSRAAATDVTGIKGTGWSGDTDTLTEIKSAVSEINVQAQRHTQEI